MTKQLSMDRAVIKMAELHTVMQWLLRHWKDFPEDVCRQGGKVMIPDDPRRMTLQLLHEDMTNHLTAAKYWRDLAEADGINLEVRDDDLNRKGG